MFTRLAYVCCNRQRNRVLAWTLSLWTSFSLTICKALARQLWANSLPYFRVSCSATTTSSCTSDCRRGVAQIMLLIGSSRPSSNSLFTQPQSHLHAQSPSWTNYQLSCCYSVKNSLIHPLIQLQTKVHDIHKKQAKNQREKDRTVNYAISRKDVNIYVNQNAQN